jgi:hypothetical protein
VIRYTITTNFAVATYRSFAEGVKPLPYENIRFLKVGAGFILARETFTLEVTIDNKFSGIKLQQA